jgi:hypothetical protein
MGGIGFSLCVKLVSGTTVGPANLFAAKPDRGRVSGPNTG